MTKLHDGKGEAQLSPTMTTVFRSYVMRASFLSQDRLALGEAEQSLAQHMSRPSTSSMGIPRDWEVVCLATTGMVQRLGRHRIKTTSNLQTSVDLTVSESEFYALVHGEAHALELQAYGINLPLIIESDSSSAMAFASRRGFGKHRHVRTRHMWIQDLVAADNFEIKIVPTTDNVSDILTQSSMTAKTPRQRSQDNGFPGSAAEQFEHTILNEQTATRKHLENSQQQPAAVHSATVHKQQHQPAHMSRLALTLRFF